MLTREFLKNSRLSCHFVWFFEFYYRKLSYMLILNSKIYWYAHFSHIFFKFKIIEDEHYRLPYVYNTYLRGTIKTATFLTSFFGKTFEFQIKFRQSIN